MDLDNPEASEASASSEASTSQLQVLPYITVQHDCQEVIQDIADGTVGSESFWISVYKEGSKTVHGRVKVSSSLDDDTAVQFEAQDGIDFHRASSTTFYISCKSLGIDKTLVHLPKRIRKDLLKDGIDCMRVAPDGERYVIGGRNGALHVGALHEATSNPISLRGHVGDILSCQFFPSSQVVVSSSSDLSIRVFSALDGSNPRTLTGHTAAVTSVAILGRGRHILSSSNDGSVKLWHVGDSRCMKTWRFGRKRVTQVVTVPSGALDVPADQSSSLKLENQSAWAATEDGTLHVLKLDGQSSDGPLYSSPLPNAKSISALAVVLYDDNYTLAAGSTNGILYILKSYLEAATKPHLVARIKRNGADITSLAFDPSSDASRPSILAATSDGLPFEVVCDLETGNCRIACELAGYNIDACNAIAKVSEGIYTAGKDGHLRRY